MKIRTFIVAVLALAAAVACKSQYELLLNSNDADAKYEAAFNYFNEGKYSRAVLSILIIPIIYFKNSLRMLIVLKY